MQAWIAVCWCNSNLFLIVNEKFSFKCVHFGWIQIRLIFYVQCIRSKVWINEKSIVSKVRSTGSIRTKKFHFILLRLSHLATFCQCASCSFFLCSYYRILYTSKECSFKNRIKWCHTANQPWCWCLLLVFAHQTRPSSRYALQLMGMLLNLFNPTYFLFKLTEQIPVSLSKWMNYLSYLSVSDFSMKAKYQKITECSRYWALYQN